MVVLAAFGSPNNNTMHAKPDLRVEFVHSDHLFWLGDLRRYSSWAMRWRYFGKQTARNLAVETQKASNHKSWKNRVLECHDCPELQSRQLLVNNGCVGGIRVAE